MEAKAAADTRFGDDLDQAHVRHARERDSLIEVGTTPRPDGGIGGSARGVKCLHAHYADYVAIRGRDDTTSPVGEIVADWIEPLDCVLPCVIDGESNPAWKARP